MVFAGDRRGSIRRLTLDRMPVGALPVVVRRPGMTLRVPGLLCSVTFPVRVNVCERCRTAGCHQHRREQHRHDSIGHHSYADARPGRCQRSRLCSSAMAQATACATSQLAAPLTSWRRTAQPFAMTSADTGLA